MKQITILLLLITTIACNNTGTTNSNDDWQQGSSPSTSETPAPQAANQTNVNNNIVEILDPSGALFGSIQPGRNSTIQTTSLSLKGSYTKADKKKYRSGSGTYAEVKMKDYGFKVRKPNGDLLWKVKIMEDGRLKISDNEEGLNAFKLSLTGSGDLKLKRDQYELARIPFDPNDGNLQLMDGQVLKISPNTHPNLTWAVLAIQDIQPIHQLVIITELLSR